MLDGISIFCECISKLGSLSVSTGWSSLHPQHFPDDRTAMHYAIALFSSLCNIKSNIRISITFAFSIQLFLAGNALSTTVETALGIPKADLISQAQKGDYLVRVLSGIVDGTPRYVVLLGEIHAKDESADQLGRLLLDQFPFRGLEGAATSSSLIDTMLLPFKLKSQLFLALYSLCHFRPCGSTIQAALEEGERLSPEDTKEAPVHNVYLEAGASDIVTLATSTYSFLMVVNLLAFPALLRSNTLEKRGFFSLATITLTGGYLMIEPVYLAYKTIMNRGKSKAYFDDGGTSETDYPILFPYRYYLNNYRNSVMSGNILRALQSHRDKSSMLVVVGMAHVPSLAKILKEEHGFEEISF